SISGLVVDPHEAATVYALTAAGSRSALLRTRNGGRTWKSIGFEAFPYALRLDARYPNLLYAGTTLGLYRSPDAGGHWTVLAFAGLPVLSLAIDPFDDRRLLAAVGGGAAAGVWRSSDRGETWQPTPLPSAPGAVDVTAPSLAFDPARRGTAYAFFFLPAGGDTPSLFRTGDGGASWTALPAAAGIHDLAAAPGGTLYAATDFGVAHSDDAGWTWQPPLANPSPTAAAPPDAIGIVIVSPGLPETLFAAGGQGVWASASGGRQWADSSRGILALTVFSLAAAPSGPATVLAVAEHGIFASRDHGHGWQVLHTDFAGPQPDRLLAFDPHDPLTIYGFGSDGQADHLFKSADGGHSWFQFPFPYSCFGGSLCDVEMSTLALVPASPGAVVVGGFFFTHADSGHFLLRSDDDGATWRTLATPDSLGFLSPVRLEIDATAPAHFYLLSCQGIFGSQDAGASWNPLGGGLPRARLCPGGQPVLALDPLRPRIVHVGTRGRGVYRSTDGGATFRPFGKGLEFAAITALVIDPLDPDQLYAAVSGQGVWAWHAELQTWEPANAGLPLDGFDVVLALDPQAPATLYAATLLGGVFRLQPP
ncbi:MAG TPA: hypothetical protein VE075_11480, partial [Thermoanaerobaculia bacterium]|nr:hypothetical protein [Thermoanaerobaculia bacterium]